MAYGTTMRNNAYLCSALLGTPISHNEWV